jgi:cyclopropane fatty-acyl-phospholipid synthase-like methyltransferase
MQTLNMLILTHQHIYMSADPPMLTESDACERNKAPILAVLLQELAGCRRVLEVGSGTGQHAVYFAAALPQLVWQPSELPENLPALAERVRLQGGPNLRAPLVLDVQSHPWPVGPVDALFSANTLHIMGWSAVRELFRGAAAVLEPPGVLCVYGPFRFAGRHTSESNAAFDQYLRRRDAQSGVRDFEALDALAHEHGLALQANHGMPANNRTLVWRMA